MFETDAKGMMKMKSEYLLRQSKRCCNTSFVAMKNCNYPNEMKIESE